MKTKWYLDKGMGESTDKIATALKALNIEYRITDIMNLYRMYDPFTGQNYDRDLEKLTTVYGGIYFIQEWQRKILSTLDKDSIIFSNFDKLRWMDYANTIKDYLWNWDYEIMPWGELRRVISPSTKVFVKPERSTKSFEAFVVSYNEGWPHLQISDRELCVVAPQKVPVKEWRCWMVDGFCGGATYRPEIGEPAPYDITSFADQVHRVLKDQGKVPDRAYTIDVGMDDKGNLGVIELNSFSCAGIYLNDPKKVTALVASVNEAIIKEYNDATAKTV